MTDCTFCKIVDRKLPATIRLETDNVLAFDDIHPQAPTHVLVIPKRHIEHLGTAMADDNTVLATILPAVTQLAHELNLDGFRVKIANGAAYGQEVPHLHLHILSGQSGESAV